MRKFIGLAATALFLCLPAAAQTAGQPLPPWTPGTLDIHQINTGKGNSALFILPDGTSLLVDAGDGSHQPPRGTAPKPDASRPAGEWIARYARHMLRHDSAPAIDYAYLTHFHDDHMGAITEVAKHIPFRALIDRGWPSYDYPAPPRGLTAYRAFAEAQSKAGVKVERLVPGRKDQLVLKRAPAQYPNFEIRNIAANGEIWTGVGTNTRQHFPPIATLQPTEHPSENMCSMAFRLSYGKFDFFSGGDMPGVRYEWAPVWNDVETPVAQVVGPVEAMILNHHGNRDSTNAFLLGALRPQVFLISVWTSNHPGEDVWHRLMNTRIYPGPRDVFATNMQEGNRLVIGPSLDQLKSAQGHIVIRVAPGGESFRVLILDDSAESFRITAAHGPYQTR
jgi:beta-lactamase superfamily II metal-dependent hydrolase